MALRASVVVPTYRRDDLLLRCLTALLRQDIDPASYDIWVADDAASPDTRALVERLAAGQAHPALHYLPVCDTQGPAAARNAGWRAAQGQIIAFTDDDCVPQPGWLRAGLAAFADDVAGVGGLIVMPLPEDPTDYELNAAGLAGVNYEFVTANAFYRRDALEAVGGFDEQFELAWREDVDLFFTLAARGYRLERTSEAVVVHPIRPAPWGVSLRQQRKNMYNALLYKKHPAQYRAYIQSGPPWRYYFTLTALLAALYGLVTGRRRLALSGAGMWAALTARFAADRLSNTSRAPSHVAEMIVTSALIPPLAVFWRLRGALKFRTWFL